MIIIIRLYSSRTFSGKEKKSYAWTYERVAAISRDHEETDF